MAICGELSGNAKSLITSASLFFTITFLQYIASLPKFANSLALRADCLSMFVDGVSYLGNLAAEWNPNERSKKEVELSVAGLSLTVLLGFTIVFLFEALNEVFIPSRKLDDDVDARIVLGFALLGLLFDVISIYAFFKWSDSTFLHSHLGGHDNAELQDGQSKGPTNDTRAKDLNVLSALLHIWSDLLRSLTTLIEAVIILTEPSFASEKVDGICALIVCSIITLTTVTALVTWVRELRSHIEQHLGQDYEQVSLYELDKENKSADNKQADFF